MTIDSLLPLVAKPGRYSGNEFNAIQKDWSRVELRIALAFPDLYEIGMSHQGLQILYRIINSRDDLLAERVYAPDRDLEDLLRQQNIPLFSLESRRALKEFDMLGITLPYELCYTNILTILDLADIPFRSADRNENHPLIIGGGPCAFHPEPVADYFDAVLLGDGEEAILEIADVVMAAKNEGVSRANLLEQLSGIQGIYIPSYFSPQYDKDGRFLEARPLKGSCQKVRRRVLPDLDAVNDELPAMVPLAKIVHDRLSVEIARGCTRGCRFCQAGIIYRPVRERSAEKILSLARSGIEQGGFEELALLSLSTGDYSCLSDVLIRLMDSFADQHVSVSMPSMRVGTLTPEVMEQIKRVRKTGFTLAPEAGTDRLRRVINKGITEEDLLETCKAAFGLGWKLVKLYFMFGLPTETQEDFEAIPELARKALGVSGGGRCRINVSAATFVPKPHTPFEREPQLSVEEGFVRIDYLKDNLRSKGFNVKWHNPRQSFMEGVFSRGDRKLSQVIEEAWRQGARLDAWSDYFDFDIWQQAAAICEIDLSKYLRRRDPQEPLPWDHLDVGVDESFFKEEFEKALKEIYTPDCRVHGCQKCGLCDFKTIKPIVSCRAEKNTDDISTTVETTFSGANESLQTVDTEKKERLIEEKAHFVYRCSYSKAGRIRFLSHLELIQVFFRAFRRAKLLLNFSQGFNPSPKVSFGPALPLGTESLAEYLLIDLYEPLNDLPEFIDNLNRQLPDGLVVNKVDPAGKSQTSKVETCYHVDLDRRDAELDLDIFLKEEKYLVELVRKRKKRKLDIRPLVKELSITDDGKVQMILISETSKAGVKPMEVLASLLNLSDKEARTTRVVKMWFKEFE